MRAQHNVRRSARPVPAGLSTSRNATVFPKVYVPGGEALAQQRSSPTCAACLHDVALSEALHACWQEFTKYMYVLQFCESPERWHHGIRGRVCRDVGQHVEGRNCTRPGKQHCCHGFQCQELIRKIYLTSWHHILCYCKSWLYHCNAWACLQRFDKTRAAPCLVRALEEGTLSVKDKRVLIPGCGYVSFPLALILAPLIGWHHAAETLTTCRFEHKDLLQARL